MSAVEEHKPVEKRRALGRGLDSLLPAGPRVVTGPAASAAPGPVAIPAPSIAPPNLVPIPGEIAEIHAGREKSPPRPNLDDTPASRTEPALSLSKGVSEPHGQEIIDIPLDLIDENPYQTRRTFDAAA